MTRLFVFVAVMMASQSARSDDGVRDKVNPIAAKLLEAAPTGGFVVGVRVGGKDFVQGYGEVVLPGGKQSPDGDTLFEIGSITKTFTGVLLAEGIRRGELAAEASASKYLPSDVPLPAAITLEHLATHRSGLPSQPPLIGAFAKNAANPYADYDRRKLAKLLEKLKPDEPGKKHVYSNLGAGLAGIAAVHAAKAGSFDELVRVRIAKPLGMNDTAEALTGAQRARLAAGHDAEGKPTSPWDFACLEACGGLRSTANDMLRYAAANMGEVDAAIVPAMKASHVPRADVAKDRARIGLFWITSKNKHGELLWHNGGTGGYRSMLALLPEKKIAVVLLAATANDAIDEHALKMLTAIAEAP